jgi:hypothetical protein
MAHSTRNAVIGKTILSQRGWGGLGAPVSDRLGWANPTPSEDAAEAGGCVRTTRQSIAAAHAALPFSRHLLRLSEMM